MAGTLNVDTLKADSNLRLQVASANVAFIDANGLTIVGNSLNIGGVRIVVSSNNSISTSNVVGANILTTTGTTALGITANGQITTANAPFILTGGQIKFPATQIASGDANTLDDYEEGTWTPTFVSSSGSITTYSSTGNYIKIGRMVYLWGAILVTTKGTASGYGNWGGAPFTSIPAFVANGNRTAIFGVREDYNTGTFYQGYMNCSNTNGDFLTLINGALTWSNGDIWEFSFAYETAV